MKINTVAWHNFVQDNYNMILSLLNDFFSLNYQEKNIIISSITTGSKPPDFLFVYPHMFINGVSQAIGSFTLLVSDKQEISIVDFNPIPHFDSIFN